MAPEVWIGLGSNEGDRLGNLQKALQRLRSVGSIELISSVYETEPWGKTDQSGFLNAVCSLHPIETDPSSLLKRLKSFERELGRDEQGERWGPRIIDLDILFWDELIVENSDLTIPHPLIAQRRFVLEPLCEVAPDLIHPKLKKSIGELLELCVDRSKVRKLGELFDET